MSAAGGPRATPAERERLLDDFVRLCEIESPSRRERRVADFVTAELRAAGIEVVEDDSGATTGSDCGNLLARIPGAGPGAVMLCAHLDTVPLDAPVEVEREDGVLRNRHPGVLGADNKAAVAALVGLARRLAREPAPIAVELLFTTCEEIGLQGAKAFDRSLIGSEYAFVLDHASPIGEVMVAAPTYYRLEATFLGTAAHAGIRPEAGRNAIAAAARALAALEFGRLDRETTANAGRIEGGTATNVVAERCRVELEARSLSSERATEVVTEMVDRITAAASDAECDVETVVEQEFRGYRMPRSAVPVTVAASALQAMGIEPAYEATGGGSDANVFNATGLPCVLLANGTERNHQPDESVTVDALHANLDVVLGLVAHSA